MAFLLFTATCNFLIHWLPTSLGKHKTKSVWARNFTENIRQDNKMVKSNHQSKQKTAACWPNMTICVCSCNTISVLLICMGQQKPLTWQCLDGRTFPVVLTGIFLWGWPWGPHLPSGRNASFSALQFGRWHDHEHGKQFRTHLKNDKDRNRQIGGLRFPGSKWHPNYYQIVCKKSCGQLQTLSYLIGTLKELWLQDDIFKTADIWHF